MTSLSEPLRFSGWQGRWIAFSVGIPPTAKDKSSCDEMLSVYDENSVIQLTHSRCGHPELSTL